jgi:hypothetical protein
MMIIYLTKTNDQEVAVNLNMVTYMEKYGDHCEVHFPYSYILVKETLDEIKLFLDRKRIMDLVRKG